MKRIIVTYDGSQLTANVASIWIEDQTDEPIRAIPKRKPDHQISGTFLDIAGTLYRFGIEQNVAEIAIDVSQMGALLNSTLAELRYPRMYHERMYRKSNESGWMPGARREANGA